MTAHIVGSIVKRAVEVVAEGGEAASETASGEHATHHGPEITTGILLGILTALSCFTLLWETITSLDGPNAPHDSAPEQLLQHAHNGHGIPSALSTPAWRGTYSKNLPAFPGRILTFALQQASPYYASQARALLITRINATMPA